MNSDKLNKEDTFQSFLLSFEDILTFSCKDMN